ncbi:hypothetical protein [Maridesulfovibrio sp.]|uniref:hypothetical protein n=1 Tax=Maridesulfovibrio sp. TaxID=2795000 RepID=UPI002A1898A6|nr:hypothetical protein [Maridesulfovibrio sp.]
MSRNTIIFSISAFVAVFFAVWFSVPRPEIVVSILIRLVSFFIAVYVALKYREWKVLFLGGMFLLMAVRQAMTFLLWTNVLPRNQLTNALSEVPGFVVTVLSLVSVVYLGLILSGKIRQIETQEDRIKTLNDLLPICAKCRKVRDDDGYWKELETYIESHTESQFSHGLCESCADELYGEQEWYKNSKKKRGR